MMEKILMLLAKNSFIRILLIAVTLDTLLGVLRAIKEHKFKFFCLLFILYEAVSILKNMTLCGLPVPVRIKKWVQKFLEDMTEELPEEAVKHVNSEIGTEGE